MAFVGLKLYFSFMSTSPRYFVIPLLYNLVCNWLRKVSSVGEICACKTDNIEYLTNNSDEGARRIISYDVLIKNARQPGGIFKRMREKIMYRIRDMVAGVLEHEIFLTSCANVMNSVNLFVCSFMSPSLSLLAVLHTYLLPHFHLWFWGISDWLYRHVCDTDDYAHIINIL